MLRSPALKSNCQGVPQFMSARLSNKIKRYLTKVGRSEKRFLHYYAYKPLFVMLHWATFEVNNPGTLEASWVFYFGTERGRRYGDPAVCGGSQVEATVATAEAIVPAGEGDEEVLVTVQGNDIEKALKQLKRKLQTDGFFRELKNRRYYEKPSVKRKRKQAEAEKKRRKALRFKRPDKG